MFHNMRGPNSFTFMDYCRSTNNMRVWSLSHYIIPHLETFSHNKSEKMWWVFFVSEKVGFARIFF